MKRITILSIVGVFALALLFSYTLAKPKKVDKSAWMGVYTQTVDYEIAEAFDLNVKYGAIVNRVAEDSPAEEAGVQEDDIIISVDGNKVTDAEELTDIILDHEPGDQINVTVLRDNNELTLNVELDGKRRSAFIFDGHDRHGVRRYHIDPDIDFNFDFGKDFVHEPHGYIGVSLISLSEQLADYFGASRGGVLISEIEEESPAEEAGLKAGDVIVAVNNEKVDDFSDITDEIRDMEEGETVNVEIIRNKRNQTIAVEVGERESNFRSYGLNVPDLPRFNINIPKMRGLHKGYAPHDGVYFFDSDEMHEEMETLKKELKELQEQLSKELQELKKSRR